MGSLQANPCLRVVGSTSARKYGMHSAEILRHFTKSRTLSVSFLGIVFLTLAACSLGPATKPPDRPEAKSYFNKAKGFDLNVHSIAVTGSRVVAAGAFFSFNRTITNKIAVFGKSTLDPSFISGTGFSNLVRSIAFAKDGSGDIYVVGDFTSYNGTSNVMRIVRLNSDGSIDSGFNTGSGPIAGLNSFVHCIVAASDGSGDVYVAGDFTVYNGASARRIVRLNSDGSLDAGFDSGAAGFDSPAYWVVPADDGSGDVYVGGQFSSYNGASDLRRIVRLNSDGSIDAGFNIGAGATAGFNNTVRTIVPAGDGSGDIYVGGGFTSYNGTSNVNRMVRLNSDGSIDAGFNTGTGVSSGFNNEVFTIARSANGSGAVYVGGFLTSYNGTQNLNYIVRLNADGSIDPRFNTGVGTTAGFSNYVLSIVNAQDGSNDVYVGGAFSSYGGSDNVRRLTKLHSDGRVDEEFASGTRASASFFGSVKSVAPAGDGSGDVYVGGGFTSFNGVSNVNHIARLNSDGSLDLDFNIGVGTSAGLMNGDVQVVTPALDGSGDIYAGGQFITYNGTPNVNRIVRLNKDGSIDMAFNTGLGPTAGFDSSVSTIARAGDGSGDIYVGGRFTSYNGTSNLNQIVRLNSDGSVDRGFNSGMGATAGFGSGTEVLSIVPAGDGTGDIYVGGRFTTYNGSANANNLIRLNPDGSIDSSFNTGIGASAGFNRYLNAIALAGDGTGDIYVGGDFTSYGGTQNINRMVRLNSDGSVDSAFNIGSGATAGFLNELFSILPAGDGSGDLYVGGSFSLYNGVSEVNRISRLNPDGSIDTGFITPGPTTGANAQVYSMALVGDGSGRFYIGGAFSSYGGATHTAIGLLSSSGNSL